MANEFEHTSPTTREFTLEFLEQITDNFSEKHIIGSGGYGTVYKGVLENGEEIALKKLHYMSALDDTQFMNEFNNLMRAQHQNIARLVGYCYDIGHQRIMYNGEYVFAHMEERVLCFEYLPGGSLDKHISDESCGLDWHTRFNIIKGVCEGLNYLHNGCKDPIYHLDLKPANILLDKNMVPKIGDFGLSRLFTSSHTYMTKKATGTPGYMPPEFIKSQIITSKYDVFSLGVTIVRIMAGEEGYSKCAQMSPQEFIQHVHENWGKRLQETMSSHTAEQVKTCIEIALRCLEVDRLKRPTIAVIVDGLKKVDDAAESSIKGQVAKNQNSDSERRGVIVFSTTGRPFSMSLGIYSCPVSPSSVEDELCLIANSGHNYNGSEIPPAALKALLKAKDKYGTTLLTNLEENGLSPGTTDADVDAGHVSGLVFVSELEDYGLEQIFFALRFNANSKVEVFGLDYVLAGFNGMRMDNSGCIGGGYSVGSRTVDDYLIYVSTKEPAQECHSPWTVVYKTSLITGKTERLTPQGVFDLSPAVSPSGKTVAVASFQNKSWNGEIENLKTDIYMMNVDNEEGLGRKLLIKDGGWPSWGSDNIVFFHRGAAKTLPSGMVETSWGVFRYNISTEETVRVTPEDLDAVTPAAISETKVVVATIRQKYNHSSALIPAEAMYRHIEIFDMNASGLPPLQITRKMRPDCDHYNPFVMDGGQRIGYECLERYTPEHGVHMYWDRLESPVKDVGLRMVAMDSMFPAISKDGSKLAFIDKLKVVWVADSQGQRIVYEERGPNIVSGSVWNQNPEKDILYVCIGPSEAMEIYSIHNVSGPVQGVTVQRLTHGGFCNTFPSSSPDGKKIVFASTRPSENYTVRSASGSLLEKGNSNLYLMLNTGVEESEEGWVTRLTNGSWADTHCQWSPVGDWIVFLSTRDKPSEGAAELHKVLGPLSSVHLVKAGDPTVVIRVMTGVGYFGAVFSPDGRSIAVMKDLAAPSVDPVSLPSFMPPAMGYSNIFVVDIDLDNLKKKKKNKDVIKCIHRMTHSRYGCSGLAWTSGLDEDSVVELWNNVLAQTHNERQKWELTSPGGNLFMPWTTSRLSD